VLAWRWVGNGGAPETLRGISVSREAPSIFSSLSGSKKFYQGPIAPFPANQKLFSCLKASLPLNAVLLPIPIHGKDAVLLYGDNGPRGTTGIDLSALKRLARKASVALEVLILKNKIRML